MSIKSLMQIYQEHNQKVSDKWSLYLKEYDSLFQTYRDQSISLLEIGIQNGGSLEIYDKYFEFAKVIIGCDIDASCKTLNYDSDKIKVIVGNANSQNIKESQCEKEKQQL